MRFFSCWQNTEDIALAAIVGAVAGLALVVIQRFVKSIMGGFAVFGTIMLLVSAFSALQTTIGCR